MLLNQEKYDSLMSASKQAIEKWGVEAQIQQMIEESSELICELARIKREGRTSPEQITEEMVDCYIMIHEMICVFGDDLFKSMFDKKMDRFIKKLNA